MKNLSVKQEQHTFNVYDNNKVFAQIIFDENRIDATLKVGNKTLQAVRAATKDMELKEGPVTLFSFKFDYIWGGAEIISDSVDTGFDIKGRWFKPGTRLTDDADKDLVVAVKKGNGLEVSVLDEAISPTMIVATIYYHIYSSGGKMRSVLGAVS